MSCIRAEKLPLVGFRDRVALVSGGGCFMAG